MTGAGDFTRGPLAWPVFRFGSLLALGMVGHGLFNLVDMRLVADLGPGAVAAVTIAGVVLIAPCLLLDGVNSLTTTLVAACRARQNPRAASRVAVESLAVTLATGLVLGGALALAAPFVVGLYNLGHSSVEADAVTYFRVMSGALLGMFLMLQAASVLRGLGSSGWPLAILLGANLANLVLDIGLIYGRFGLPRLGVAGAAWATAIAQGAGGVLGVILLWRGVGGVSLGLGLGRSRITYAFLLLKDGLPASLQLVVRILAVSALLYIARRATNLSGPDFWDGVGLSIRLQMLIVFLGLGWASAANTVVGQNLAVRNLGRAQAGTWWLIAFNLGTMGLLAILFWACRGLILPLLMPRITAGALAAADDYLRILLPFLVLLSFDLVITRALHGARSTRRALLVDTALYVVIMLPVAALLTRSGTGAGEVGAWWAASGTHALAALVYLGLFWQGFRHRRRRDDPIRV
jgi:putative MATE family efflux protein